MTDPRAGRRAAAPGADAPAPLSERLAALADRPSPALPPGPPGQLGNRILVYLRPGQVDPVLPHLDSRRSGLILAGAQPGPLKALQALRAAQVRYPVLIDPASYEKFAATCEVPFILPGAGDMAAPLADYLDAQVQAGVSAALTPTGFIPAGATDVLKTAARQFVESGHADAIFVAPLDVSLLGRAFFRQTAAILADLGGPIALVLGRQGDPLAQSREIIPNLRSLAASVPLIAMRTDFNGFDLVAHGAISAAIGTGGSTRHTVDPAQRPMSFVRNQSPSVLVPELASWFKGTRVAELFGARPSIAPRCFCAVCCGQKLDRFLKKEGQGEAIAHGVVVWSGWARDLLAQPTMHERAEYWKGLCTGAVYHHAVLGEQLQLLDGLRPQEPLKQWSALPAWAAGLPSPVL